MDTLTKALLLLMALLSLAAAAPVQGADDWKLTDKDGVRYQLSGLKGKWVLVNFWAPWCPPCLGEMPDLNALQKQHADLQVIGVAVMYRNKREVMSTLQAHPLAYPIVMGDEDIASDFGEIHGMPTSFLYAPDGKLVGRHEGPLSRGDVEAAMQKKPASATLFTRRP